jgi:hypothetical protein
MGSSKKVRPVQIMEAQDAKHASDGKLYIYHCPITVRAHVVPIFMEYIIHC